MSPPTTDPSPHSPAGGCIGCHRTVRLAPGEVDRLLTDYLRTNPTDLCSPALAEQRLKICSTCPDLHHGTTCRHCGCLVEIRVHLATKSCPAPSPRWSSI